MTTDIALSDYLEIRNVAYEWAQSYDNKEWDRLKLILAPKTRLDFRTLKGPLHENLSPDEYVAILVGMIGDKRLKTQHLLGGAKWECLSDGTVQVAHQIRVAHQRYVDDELSAVENKGHGYGVTTHLYRKIDGAWKLESSSSRLEWSEYDLFGTLTPKKEAS